MSRRDCTSAPSDRGLINSYICHIIHWFCKRAVKILIRPCQSAGCPGLSLLACDKGHFLMLFKYQIQGFLDEIETGNFTISNNEITTFGFSRCWTTSFLQIEFLINSMSKSSLKGLWHSNVTCLKFCEDVNGPRSNPWRHLLHWRNYFSARDVRRTIVYCGIFSVSISCVVML